MLKKDFWKNKKLSELDHEEWEALCDRCGKCCLIKLEDEKTSKILYTNVSCQLLCQKNAVCLRYSERKKIVKDCVEISYKNVHDLKWMPKTCSYRLIDEGKPLPLWHYLIHGNFERMIKEKKCVRNRVINEKQVKEKHLQKYIYEWEKF